ncbi:MAG: class I SAM-dependent methyltransferase [Cyclobacteriaceae bacterium]
MQLSEAINLIRGAAIPHDRPAVWADLGCGSGLFTQALARLLPDGSTIYAVDKKQQRISPPDNRVKINFLQADFEKDEWVLPPLQGILMANSLHYVAGKQRLLKYLLEKMSRRSMLIIVEYDSLRANPWVPYPINFSGLKKLLEEAGCTEVTQLGERPSRYRPGNIYASIATVPN